MKTYVHARLGESDRVVLDRLKRATGHSESEIVRHGLKLLAEKSVAPRSALELAGRSVGRFKKGPKDLSSNKRRLDGFGA
jgi:hypothetical protein